MESLKRMSTLLFVLGSIFAILGLTQSFPLDSSKLDSYVYDKLYLERTIRTYVFLTAGGLSLLFGYFIRKVNDEVKEEIKYYHQKISKLEER
ncbi:hypothetical protein ACWE42_11980 [Sutcliffiella cohnii]